MSHFLKCGSKSEIQRITLLSNYLGKSRRPSERAIKRQYLSRIRALTALTQRNHCVFRNFSLLHTAVFSQMSSHVSSTKRFSPPFRSECGSKVQTQKYKLPSPLEHVFIFPQWLQTRIPICCPAAPRLTLPVGLRALLSQLRRA